MSMILYDDFRVFLLYAFGKSAQECGAADTGHVLQTNLGCSGSDELIGDTAVVFHCVYRRTCDTECRLRYHACLEGIFDRRYDVACVIQSAEDTGYVNALGFLYLVHEASYISRNREHTQCVECSVEHVGLDSRFVERLCKASHSLVGVLSGHEVDLLECSSISLDAGETSHFDNSRRYFLQLLCKRLELS